MGSRDVGNKTIQISKSSLAEQMRLEYPPRACFVIIGGMDIGRIIPLDKPEMTIGRDPICSVVLRDDDISRLHAKVVREGDGPMVLRDLGSTNGTFVNGGRLGEAELKQGDKILLGTRTILKFELFDMFEETYQKQIYESSTRDGLTGIFNRKYFNHKFVSDLSFARRHRTWLTLVMLDLDHFKTVNDTYGHQAGDRVLMGVTASLLAMLRSEDVLARYGGEEFVLIAPGTNYEGGLVLGDRILTRVAEEPISVEDGSGRELHVTASVGLAAVTPGAKIEPETVIAAADENLYAAKNTGRNRVVGSLLK